MDGAAWLQCIGNSSQARERTHAKMVSSHPIACSRARRLIVAIRILHFLNTFALKGQKLRTHFEFELLTSTTCMILTTKTGKYFGPQCGFYALKNKGRMK
jgi:hypothetical protein